MSLTDQNGVEKPDTVKAQGVPPVSMQDQSTIALSLSLIVVFGLLYFLLFAIWQNDYVQLETAPPLVSEFQVDINKAEWPEIAALPDIGPTRARQIVQWRDSHGPFRTLDDLQEIHGIGPATVQSIAPYLRREEPVRHVVSKPTLATNNLEQDQLAK